MNRFDWNQVDAKAVADGDTVTVYVSAADPRESLCIPPEVNIAAVKRSKAREKKKYAKADELHNRIIDAGYRLDVQFCRVWILLNKYFKSLPLNFQKCGFHKLCDQGTKYSEPGDSCSEV